MIAPPLYREIIKLYNDLLAAPIVDDYEDARYQEKLGKERIYIYCIESFVELICVIYSSHLLTGNDIHLFVFSVLYQNTGHGYHILLNLFSRLT